MNYATFGQYQKEAECCLPVLVTASNIAETNRKEILDNLETYMRKKDDGSKVTICDYLIQTYIVSAILSQFPDDYIMGEESLDNLQEIHPEFLNLVKSKLPASMNIEEVYSQVHKTIPEEVHRFWVIDPLDGTSGYVKPPGLSSQYAIAIALIVDNDCVFSAVAWPTQEPKLSNLEKAEPVYCLAARTIGSFYTTQSTYDACKSSGNDNYFTQIQVNHRAPFKNIMPPVPKRFEYKNQNIFQEVFPNKRYYPIKCTSMSKGLSLAFSVASYYDRLSVSGCENVWDIAPFSMFIEEAGGFSTTWSGSKLFFQNDGRVRDVEHGTFYSIRDQRFHDSLLEANKRVNVDK